MLSKIYRKAVKAGGADMPKAKYARVFGNDSVMRRNVLHACAHPRYGRAIQGGTFADHRVIESLRGFGELAAGFVLDTEAKLGRKLSRARAYALLKAYRQVVISRHLEIEVPRNVIAFPLAA